jgi:hypothetical protein
MQFTSRLLYTAACLIASHGGTFDIENNAPPNILTFFAYQPFSTNEQLAHTPLTT